MKQSYQYGDFADGYGSPCKGLPVARVGNCTVIIYDRFIMFLIIILSS